MLILDQCSNSSVGVVERCCSISWPRISTGMSVTRVYRDQLDAFWRHPTGKMSSMPYQKTGAMKSAFLHLLKKRMKMVNAAQYVPDFPILKPRENRVKMRLLLGTRSAHGVDAFREAQWKVERGQIKMRHRIRREESRLFHDCFPTKILPSCSSKLVPVLVVQNFRGRHGSLCLTGFRNQSHCYSRTSAIDTMEAVPIRKTQIKDLLREMQAQGRVAFTLPGRKIKPLDGTRINLVETFSALNAD